MPLRSPQHLYRSLRTIYQLLNRRLHTLNELESGEPRRWVEQFRATPLQRSNVELSFARSSGPGGQNVNKVNSKVMAKCSVDSPWIPLWARENLRLSPAYVSAAGCLQVTSTLSRSQAQNVDDCLRKLHALVLDTVISAIRNEPSGAQRKRVSRLINAEKSRCKVLKAKRKDIKGGRSRVLSQD